MPRLIFVLSLVGLTITLAACSSGPQVADDSTPSELAEFEPYDDGHQAMEQGRWEDASRFYGQAAREVPHSWQAHLNHAIALTRDESFGQALEAFERALEAGGDDHAVVYFNLGNHYQARALYHLSINPYRMAMAVGEDDDLSFDALLNIAASLHFLNRPDEALEALAHARELRPDDPRPRLTRGVLLHRQGDSAQALELMNDLLMDHPDFHTALYHRAYVLMQQGELNAALEGFKDYLDADADGPHRGQADSHISTIHQRLDRR